MTESMDCEQCGQTFNYDLEDEVAMCEHCEWANIIDDLVEKGEGG